MGNLSIGPVPMTLHVSGLALETGEATLVEHFSAYGEVKLVVLKRDCLGRSKKFGFVTLGSRSAGRRAINEKMHLVDERIIGVQIAARQPNVACAPVPPPPLLPLPVQVGSPPNRILEAAQKSALWGSGRLACPIYPNHSCRYESEKKLVGGVAKWPAGGTSSSKSNMEYHATRNFTQVVDRVDGQGCHGREDRDVAFHDGSYMNVLRTADVMVLWSAPLIRVQEIMARSSQ